MVNLPSLEVFGCTSTARIAGFLAKLFYVAIA
jgi:hypothetical protein